MITETSVRPAVILLVEDDPGDQELTRRALRESKICNELCLVEDGEEADTGAGNFRILPAWREDFYRFPKNIVQSNTGISRDLTERIKAAEFLDALSQFLRRYLQLLIRRPELTVRFLQAILRFPELRQGRAQGSNHDIVQ